jgi:A/G-specific adenine glycosylase
VIITIIIIITRMERFPSVRILAAATAEEVNVLWAGLGYYRRAAQILACAQVLVAEHGGELPDSPEALLKLPGIGVMCGVVRCGVILY